MIPLLLGEDPPPLEAVSADWLGWLAARVRDETSVDLDDTHVAVWAGMGSIDNLAPPETVRPHTGPATYVRFGYNRMDPREYDHASLLAEARPLRALARWLSQTVRSRPERGL